MYQHSCLGVYSSSSLKSKVELLLWLLSIRIEMLVVQTVCLQLLLVCSCLPPAFFPGNHELLLHASIGHLSVIEPLTAGGSCCRCSERAVSLAHSFRS